MIVHFQIIPTQHGDRIYALDDQGVLRVKQPQQGWRDVPAINSPQASLVEPVSERRHVQPLHSFDEVFRPKTSIIDGYVL